MQNGVPPYSGNSPCESQKPILQISYKRIGFSHESHPAAQSIYSVFQLYTNMYPSTAFTIAALGAVASAYDLPDNLRAIYDEHKVSRPLLFYFRD